MSSIPMKRPTHRGTPIPTHKNHAVSDVPDIDPSNRHELFLLGEGEQKVEWEDDARTYFYEQSFIAHSDLK
jgi:hypothetical protein